MILVSIRCLCYFFLTHAFANHRICHAVSQFFINVTVSFPRQSFLSSKYLSYQSLNTWSFTYKCCEQTDKKKEKEKTSEWMNGWKRLPPVWETWVPSLGWEDPLEKEIATHPSILAWRIPWMEEPGRLQSTASQRVWHDWATSFSLSLSWYIKKLEDEMQTINNERTNIDHLIFKRQRK